jgi:predicted RNA binding protein YcfA (HicA-like mRNA interferase family)
MPKLPPLTSSQVINLLKQHGFILDRAKGSHHIYYHPETKRRVTIPFHKRDVPKGTLLEILRQAGLTKDDI